MAYAFNEDKSKVEVLPASNTYAKNEVYNKTETASVLSSYVTKTTADDSYLPLSSNKLVPTGSVLPFAGTSAPSGFLLCSGQAVSRTTYAALFDVIGTTYGAGNGTTTFNLPNLQGKFPLGKSGSYSLASTGGASTVSLTTGNLPAHTHGSKSITGQVGQVLVPADTGYTSSALYFETKDNVAYPSSEAGTARRKVIKLDATHEHESVGSGTAHNNMPPYITLNYIIKA